MYSAYPGLVEECWKVTAVKKGKESLRLKAAAKKMLANVTGRGEGCESTGFSLTIIPSMFQRHLIRKQKPKDEKNYFPMIVKKTFKMGVYSRNSSASRSDEFWEEF
jgi:hypothetical protein